MKSAALLLLLIMTVPPVFAADERAMALQEFNEEVSRAYQPASPAEEWDFYSRMQGEADELININDYIEWKHTDEEEKKQKKENGKSGKEPEGKELKGLKNSEAAREAQ